MESTASLAAQHVLSHFHRVPRTQPMFVALQGPQGSGKTYLTRSLVSSLSSPPHSLRVATLSVDDLYLNHLGLQTLAAENPGNPLWRGRGQPGTHDVKLGADILRRLREVNVDGIVESQIVLPIFDKSKHNGEGDRAHAGTLVNLPIDVFILEGWCVGFYPLEQPELDEIWENVCSMSETTPGSIIQRAMEAIRKKDIEAVNHVLRDYVKECLLVCLFEGCVILQHNAKIQSPNHTPYDYIYMWRLQQEHNMKAENGGIGMTDEQVIRFVDRYIPGYVFFGKGVTQGPSVGSPPPWVGNGLRITIGQERQVLGAECF